MNSLAKKVTILQVLIVSISIFAFIVYINFYLGTYIKQETEQKITMSITELERTVQVYNSALEDTALKLYRIFESRFGSFALHPNDTVNVNGVKTPRITAGDFTLNNNFASVDAFTSLTDAVATVFVKSGDDFVRISTSLKRRRFPRNGYFFREKQPRLYSDYE